MDKYNNNHRKNKKLIQFSLNSDQEKVLEFIKAKRNILSSSNLLRLLLIEEKKRLS